MPLADAKAVADRCQGLWRDAPVKYENTSERKLRELEERVDQLSSQISQVLHEILNLREGKPYGSRE